MPSQSVEAATRDEAIAAAREQFGPTARVVGVRRIRSGGMFGFFTNERYIAEVEAGKAAAGSGPDTGSVLKSADNSRPEAPAPSMDDRMRELADLLGSASQESPSAGLYGRSGGAAASSAASSAVSSAASSAGAARPAGRSATSSAASSAAPSARATAAPSARAGKSTAAPATPRSTAAPKRAAAGAKPFTPAKHTLMLAPEDLVPGQPETAEPVAQQPSGPSPFAAALTRMVASNPVQEAADAAAEAAAEAAADKAAAEAAALAQAAAVESAVADAARAAAARIEAAAAEATRRKAEAAAAEAARLQAQAAAAEAARLQAQAAAAEAARLQAQAAAAEAARIEAARVEAQRLEAQRLEAERIEAERIEAERIEAERIEAERLQAEAAAEAEAARIEAAAEVQDAPVLSMVESVRTADEELAALLEEVLAANGSGRGRHRLPEAGAELGADTAAGAAAVAAAAAIVEAAAESAVPAVASAAVAEERVLDVPEPWVYETAAREPSAYDTGAYRTDAYAAAWTSDARVAQRAAQVAAAQNLVVDAVVVDETPAEEIRYVESRPVELVEEERFAFPLSLAPALARTASDPAPLPMDATMILPPLSLMPPQRFGSTGGTPPLLTSRPGVPPVRRGRPPVPASRPAMSSRPHVPTRPVPIPVPIGARPAAEALPAAEETGTRLATVTRLVPAVSSSSALSPFSMSGSEELVVRLLTLGLPDFLLGPDFTTDAANRGVYAALTRTLGERLPVAPQLPAEPGAVLMVVGPGAETLAAARSLALSLRLEPENVQWAASGALAGLAPESSRITSLDTAMERRRASSTTGTVTIIAVDAPLRTSGGPWLEHMLSVWSPAAVWAVLDSTRKPEDLVPWLDGLPALDAVVVQDTDSTADPAAVLSHVSVPVALVDGTRATPHRWASLLCERLEEMDA